MTYNCEELIDDDVETFVYRPRSYIEYDPDEDEHDSNLSVKLDNKNRSHEKISAPKRGSFTDLRHAILTRVSTPRGNRRSKTIVQRCQSAGESLKLALGRTSSLDVLGSNHPKSSVEELINGFSNLANKTAAEHADKTSVQESTTTTAPSHNVRGKIRSSSCPSYPGVVEKGMKPFQKSSSYDSSTCSIDESKICSSFDSVNNQYPTIKIELCSGQQNYSVNSAPLERKHSPNKWSAKNASNNSLNSINTDCSGDSSFSDNSSIFITEIPTRSGHTVESIPPVITATMKDTIIIKREAEKSPAVERRRPRTENVVTVAVNDTIISKREIEKTDNAPVECIRERRRPRSFIDIFRREKDVSSHCNTLPLPRKNKNEATDCNDNNKINTRVVDIDLSSDDEEILEGRTRATSMLELGSNKPSLMQTRLANNRHNISDITHKRAKKASSNFYGLASPATLKKLFKKKKRAVATETPKITPIAPTTPVTGQRRCIQIESFL